LKAIHLTYKIARRIAVTLVGTTVLLIGTPGPAVVFIPVGLAILGLEFAWARVWLRKVRASISANNANTRADKAEQHRQRYIEM
jgi:hypothetical protein